MKNESTKKTHRVGLIGQWLLAIGLAVLLPAAVSFAQTFTTTDLGTLGGSYSSASAVNESG